MPSKIWKISRRLNSSKCTVRRKPKEKWGDKLVINTVQTRTAPSLAGGCYDRRNSNAAVKCGICEKQKNYVEDSVRNMRWNRGPVNCTPTTFPPSLLGSVMWTTRPWVEKSGSMRREA